ncbi:MAG: tyrosine--tRNA ligase [Candidatus Falkowbacteria bacterium]|nr:tyrosine--tRNA ligase [Candidatus Falkowbacteria bacterium]
MSKELQSKIKEITERGVERVYPSKEVMEKALASGKTLTFYAGFDPNAKSLHIGNAIQLAKLSQLQAAGHKVIFLVGDFTAMIGDPTDKKAARKQLDRATVKENCKVWKKQASAWLKFSGINAAEIKYNSKWYDKMSIEEFIRLGSNFTVQQMIIRDMFQERIKEEKPIYLHEFLYPLIQAYDSVAMEVDGEVGGNDQTFNMLAGRDLMKALTGKEKFVITSKLLVDNEGKKMGKSEGNIVNLDETPVNMYGKIMSWPDGVLASAFELCTQLSWDEVKKVQERLKNTTLNPRDFKMKLAHEITKIYHGAKQADAAEENFVKTVQNKEAPAEMEVIKASDMNIIDLLIHAKLTESKSEARRLLEQGGIKINNEAIKDVNYKVTIPAEGLTIQKGKREYRKIIKL